MKSGLWGYLVALTALKSNLVAHSPALAGVRGMSQGSDATAANNGQEGRERNPWIKSRPRLDLLGMRNFPTRSRQLARALAARTGRRARRMRRSLLTYRSRPMPRTRPQGLRCA